MIKMKFNILFKSIMLVVMLISVFLFGCSEKLMESYLVDVRNYVFF